MEWSPPLRNEKTEVSGREVLLIQVTSSSQGSVQESLLLWASGSQPTVVSEELEKPVQTSFLNVLYNFQSCNTEHIESVSRSVVSDSLQSLPGSSVHGTLQARILEWVSIPFSRGSSRPRDWTQVSCMAGRFLTVWASREPHTEECISSRPGYQTAAPWSL